MKVDARKLLLPLVVTGLISLSCGNKPFRFQVCFRGSPGLKAGSEVRYLGLKVGEVEKAFIQQGEAGNSPEFAVVVAIKDRQVHVRQNDKFGVLAQGLFGDEYLAITPGPSNSPTVPENSIVQGELAAIDLQKVLKLADPYGLTAKLDSLPNDKRQKLLRMFNKVLDDAANEERQLPSKGSDSTQQQK